jgi:hypothetical protein
MNLFLRVKGIVDIILIPDTVTALKRKVVIPPKTAEGMATSAAANFAKMPMTISQKQHPYPAFRFAHLVSAITPLF